MAVCVSSSKARINFLTFIQLHAQLTAGGGNWLVYTSSVNMQTAVKLYKDYKNLHPTRYLYWTIVCKKKHTTLK